MEELRGAQLLPDNPTAQSNDFDWFGPLSRCSLDMVCKLAEIIIINGIPHPSPKFNQSVIQVKSRV
jgi:hypothetical protein